jgi:hypothetical protein
MDECRPSGAVSVYVRWTIAGSSEEASATTIRDAASVSAGALAPGRDNDPGDTAGPRQLFPFDAAPPTRLLKRIGRTRSPRVERPVPIHITGRPPLADPPRHRSRRQSRRAGLCAAVGGRSVGGRHGRQRDHEYRSEAAEDRTTAPFATSTVAPVREARVPWPAAWPRSGRR